jgi:ribosomal protein L29
MDFEDRGEGDLTLQIENLKEEIENLKAELARLKEDRQYDNLVHQQEIERLLKNEKK